jgi:carbamoyltransferase
MKVLGLYDWHNCGAALVEDGKIVAAVEEERLSRNKIEFGFPYRSIEQVLRITHTSWKDLAAIAVAGIRDPIPFARWKPQSFKFERKMGPYWNLQYRTWRTIYPLRSIPGVAGWEQSLNRKIVLKKLKTMADFPSDRVFFVDHHRAHAASGYRTSGFKEALVFCLDGSGDGFSSTVFVGHGGELEFVAGSSERASLGKLYGNVTLGLGFKKISDEGKVMGLAALGDPGPFYPIIDRTLQIRNVDSLDLVATEDLLGNGFAKKIKHVFSESYSREDICAAVQRKLEETVRILVEHFVSKTGIRRVVLAGGVAANVRMNQMVRELPCVEESFVFPNMTDGGLSAGAALEICYQIGKMQGEPFPPYRLENLYLGPEYGTEDISRTIKGHGLPALFIEDIDSCIAELVCQGKTVARFRGRMEFGPRALGNRSILALATDPRLEESLNRRLRRDEFMPFAPSMLEDHAVRLYLARGRRSPFMTETFDTAEGLEKALPSVVHVDGTCRPQTVLERDGEGFGRLIKKVGEVTAYYVVLNTSFNMHGEPIVCSPEDAINTFSRGCADYLALGNYLLEFKGEPRG